MDKNTAMDSGATVLGGGLGIEQIYEAANALLVDGATGQEWLALGKGIALIIFGFFAWRRTQPAPAVK